MSEDDTKTFVKYGFWLLVAVLVFHLLRGT